MKFSDEYKREMRALEPDEQSLARMKAAVMKAVSEQEKPKNALSLTKRIAVFGGSAAACALIAVCAVKLAPILTKTDSIISNETQSSTSLADAASVSAADSCDNSDTACDVDKSGGLTFAEDCAASEEPEDYSSFDAPIFSLTEKGSVESSKTDELPPAPDNSADANGFDGGEIANPASADADKRPPDNGILSVPSEYTAEATEEFVSEEYEYDFETECSTECATYDATYESFDGSYETGEYEEEETDEFADAVPNDGGVNAEMFGKGYVSTVIEISADEKTVWVYGDGEHKSKGRYMRVSTTERGGEELPSAELLNTADGLSYLVQLEKGAPNCIYVTDSSGRLLGKYRKNG